MRLARLGLLGIGAALAIPACGGSSSDNGGNGGNVSIDEVPALYAAAACSTVEACFGPLYAIFSNGEDCETTYQTAIGDELPRLKQGIDDGTIVYDGTKVGACLAALENRGCSFDAEPAECTAALDGTVEVGGACQMDAECKGGDTYCKTAAACPGTCAKRELAGGACDRNDNCAAGLQCNQATKKCYTPANAGEPCEGGSAPSCIPGTFCIGAEDTKPGTCLSITEAISGKQGDPCYFGGKPLCTADLRCVVTGIGANGVETQCDQPFAAGAACKVAIPDGCPLDQYCKVPANSFDGTCTPRPAAGEPCASALDSNDICAPNTRCDGGTCKPRQHLGATCQSDSVCYSDHCVNGGCAPAGACN